MATFDERAKDWDTPERIARAGEMAAAIRSAIALARADRLVDVGAGTGLLGLALVDDVREVRDDRGRHRQARGRRPADRACRAPRPAHRSPPAELFDVAVSLLVLHHLQDTRAALTAIHDLLGPGARIALADLDTEDGSFHSADAEGIHHRGFDRPALEALARDVGFIDVSTRTAMVLDEDGNFDGYAVFLLTGRRAGG
jgi:SAM-dependent methyltransferase